VQLKITKEIAEKLGEERLRPLGIEWESRGWKEYFTCNLKNLTMEQIRECRAYFSEMVQQDISGTKTLVRDIDVWLNALVDAGDTKARTVEQFAPLITEYIRMSVGHRLYRRIDLDGIAHVCYYVNNIKYHPKETRNDDRRPAYTEMELMYHELGGRHIHRVMFYAEDIRKNTASAALAKAGYFIETPELREAYIAEVTRFNAIVGGLGVQYLANGIGMDTLDGNEHIGSWSHYNSNDYKLDSTKVVMDVFYEQEDNRRDNNSGVLNQLFWQKSTPISLKVHELDEEDEVEDEDDVDADTHIAIPIHPYCATFDLRRHLRLRVHVNYLTEYVYDKQISERLVLPQVTKDLVQTLISESQHGFDDIIEGKGRGAPVLLGGPPGVGKTLTAEVFAEASEKPLYSIQAAQLGIKSDAIEDNLTRFLARGSRWNAIVLLDEADVYIRARDTDMEHNAIVAAILRVLEYQSTVMFLTTNLASSVDDAIVSRCLARINYGYPTVDEQGKIWAILAGVNEVEMSQTLIEDIVASHSRLAGRDIKQLLKLAVLHTVHSGIPISKDVIDFVAQFQPTIQDNGNVSSKHKE